MHRRSAVEILTQLEALGIRLELDIFRQLLFRLESPEHGLPTVLVAGTNGKGSVAAVLAAIGRQAGLRAGLYTSPHLDRWQERIQIAGEEIPEPRLAAFLERIVTVARQNDLPPPTPFEAMTAAALLEFRAQAVDLAILEVGLGGRLDATNAAEPVLSIVTRVALDHREYLGERLAEIAREKAGIFRAGVTALIAPQTRDADTELTAAAVALGAPLSRVTDSATCRHLGSRGLLGSSVEIATASAIYPLAIPLAGDHQIDNVATAVRAAEFLSKRWPQIDHAAICSGVANSRWPCRLEVIAHPAGPDVLLDAAHNPDGCAALARFLGQLNRRFGLVFGALGDKQVGDMLPVLAEAADSVVLTRPDSPRARAPETLRSFCSGAATTIVEDSPERALELAIDAALARSVDLVVVCGSIFLVSALRRAVRAAAASSN